MKVVQRSGRTRVFGETWKEESSLSKVLSKVRMDIIEQQVTDEKKMAVDLSIASEISY